jgi:hypothetical protein
LGWCANQHRRWIAINPVSEVPKQKTGRDIPQILTVFEARQLMEYVADFKTGLLAGLPINSNRKREGASGAKGTTGRLHTAGTRAKGAWPF